MLPIGEFGPQPSAPDGHHAWCRICVNAYARERRAERWQARITALMATAEGRTTVVAVQWRLNVTAAQAQRVAVLIEPAGSNRWCTRDRPQTVAWLSWPELVRLARRAGVRPGENRP